MSDTIDQGRDAGHDATVETRTSSGGVAVRKVASLHETGAAVVHVTVRSERLVRSRIRVVDPIPPPLADKPLEFHPHYDPVNWSEEPGAAVYEVTLVPDDERTTAYGVMLDDPGQLVLFDGEPTVEVEALDDGALGAAATGSNAASAADPSPSDADGGDPVPDPVTPDSATSDPVTSDAAAAPAASDGADDAGFSFGEPPSASSEAAVTDGSGVARPASGGSGRNAILEALGEPTGSEPSVEAGPAAVADPGADDADAFRYVADQHVELSRDVERLEARVVALADALEERQAALEETVEELERAVRRETAWREELRRTLSQDTGPR